MNGPGSAAWRLPGQRVHLLIHTPYCAPAGTRNQLRLRAASTAVERWSTATTGQRLPDCERPLTSPMAP